MPILDMNALKSAAALMGKAGGSAGNGKSKVRGNSEYYRLLSRKSRMKRSKQAKQVRQ